MKKLISLIATFTITVMIVILSPTLQANNVTYSYITDLNQLPAVNGDLTEATNRNKTGKVTFGEKYNGYTIVIEHPNGATYILASSNKIPIELQLPGVNADNKLILESGVLFKGENGEQLIYYELQRAASSRPIDTNIFNDEDIEINGFRPYVIWNFTTGVYDLTDKLTAYAVHYAGTDRRAFVDILFNIDMDQLLMIELKWQYRYKNVLGGYTGWRTDQTKRYADEDVNATNFWHEYKKLLKLDYLFKFKSSVNMERFSQQTIQELNPTTNYKYNYTSKLNDYLNRINKPTVSPNDIFISNSSMWRVYLNTYSAGLYTGYEISDDIVLLDLMYIYKGEYFHPQIEDVEWIAVGGSSSEADDAGILPKISNWFEDFFEWLKDKFGTFATIISIGLGIIVVAAIFRFLNWIKKRLF